MAVAPLGEVLAQNATVTLSSEKQYIRGFGGISHAAWLGDLNATDRNVAFGNADGQLGFTVLRIPVSDGNPNSADVATAKAAVAAGAIVFASPWNAYHVYSSADFPAYVTHLNNFVTYMAGQGVKLYAISVQNEPDWGGKSKSWGAWSAAVCHDFVLSSGAQITGTKLMSCESFSYDKSYYDPILNDSAALANLGVLGTHIYSADATNYATKLPYPLFDSKGGDKERWMTEHYTDSTTDANSWPNALGVATELHHSMVTAQFNAYVWWPIKRMYGPIYTNSTISKRGYCMAHWSKFVRPGFHRVEATSAPASNVLLSAFKSDTDVVMVIVNNNTSASSVNITVIGGSISSYAKYTTSSSKSLAKDGTVTASNGALTVSLDAQSVTTLYGSSGTAIGGGGLDASAVGGSSGTGGRSGADAGSDARDASAVGGSGAGGTTTVVEGTGGFLSTGGVSGTGGEVVPSGGTAATGSGGSVSGGPNVASAPAGCSCSIRGRASPLNAKLLVGLVLGLVAGLTVRRRWRRAR